MLGGQNKQPLGYTIIEVMVVLAISGVMFLIAASFISGKQARTAFTTGVNQLSSNLQDTIEQVTDGQYTDIPFNCTNHAAESTLTLNGTTGETQGQNPACIFLGKFVYFYGGNDPNKYDVFSLAAVLGATSLATAKVTPVIGDGIDLTNQQTTPENLSVTNIQVTLPDGTVEHLTYGGFGFTQGFGDQTVNLEYVSGLPRDDQTDADFETAFTGLEPASSANICVTDGQRYALIELGDSSNNGNQLSVDAQFLPDAATGVATC